MNEDSNINSYNDDTDIGNIITDKDRNSNMIVNY